MMKRSVIVTSLPFLIVGISTWRQTACQAFVSPQGQVVRRSAQAGLDLSSSKNRPSSSSSVQRYSSRGSTINSQDVAEMRRDIERMRQEAILRLDALNKKIHEADLESSRRQAEAIITMTTMKDIGAVETLHKSDHVVESSSKGSIGTNHLEVDGATEDDPRVQALVEMADTFDQEMRKPAADIVSTMERSNAVLQALIPPLQARTGTSTVDRAMPDVKPLAIMSPRELQQQKSRQHPLKLLDGTRWRLMLNIGREPGTWMPKTWGISGDRLYLNLELEFTPGQLYEQEDFFNGVSGSKVLNVIHNEANLAPCMQEGGRRVRVKNGGWRVVPGEGPMGTAVLRFFFDVEEETRHRGSDVYLPSGRVYCTCGYFPMGARSNADGGLSKREELEKEVHELELEYQGLQNANDGDDNLFSLTKLKRAKDMMDIRRAATELGKAIQQERMREPERSLLRLSQDQSVGLTREGGICCKKQKGVALEYHILGKFEIASMKNQEHSDYRDLLP